MYVVKYLESLEHQKLYELKFRLINALENDKIFISNPRNVNTMGFKVKSHATTIRKVMRDLDDSATLLTAQGDIDSLVKGLVQVLKMHRLFKVSFLLPSTELMYSLGKKFKRELDNLITSRY